MMKKSYIVGLSLVAAVLAGCAGSNKAPISTIGGSSGAYSGSGVHIVQKGDTLYSISRRYNVPVNRILSLNSIADPSQIEVGQRIRLSDGASNASRTAAASSANRTTNNVTASKANNTSVARASDASLIAWEWPHRGNIITGYSSSTRGIDIAGKIGDPVKAAAAGTVSYVGNGLRGLGNLVLITHSNGFISAYAHNSKLLVRQNQQVSKGQTIAELGQSDTTSPRLHFEIRRNGTPVNPQSYLPK
ncbi:peptidoglycan DD-metalloendopeptidase family protein [Pelistega sp. NLN82]|uniref:Peptidoglycan DD-metalloendopeptidase family protein n=1 Tax=Pelistega ratti TaxID=2652177 RepID=A0A6L9Y972_9BURK|nr:peptidoglycan DD-metalloendopeptidase family protein [Pelistega ratti]NEN76274.1 peptidoglycan DD-metalloendopeptidase family protein [Pelistega ratti]